MMKKMPDSIREKIDKETAAFKPFCYGYCKKCIHGSLRCGSLWCFRLGNECGKIWTCDFFTERQDNEKAGQ